MRFTTASAKPFHFEPAVKFDRLRLHEEFDQADAGHHAQRDCRVRRGAD